MSKISLKKRFSLWMLLGVLISGIIACNSTPSSTQPEIEFWTMQLQPKFTPYFNNAIATFEQENPDVKIRWIDVPWSSMETKILTAVSA